jgi:hypothetical protein
VRLQSNNPYWPSTANASVLACLVRICFHVTCTAPMVAWEEAKVRCPAKPAKKGSHSAWLDLMVGPWSGRLTVLHEAHHIPSGMTRPSPLLQAMHSPTATSWKSPGILKGCKVRRYVQVDNSYSPERGVW